MQLAGGRPPPKAHERAAQVLHKLLPLVIGRLNGASAAVQKKVGAAARGARLCPLAHWLAALLRPCRALHCRAPPATATRPPPPQVLEILSHVNKRIKALPALQLPLHELVATYRAPDSGPMARNFALVYIETAAGRAPPAARFAEVRGGPTVLPWGPCLCRCPGCCLCLAAVAMD